MKRQNQLLLVLLLALALLLTGCSKSASMTDSLAADAPAAWDNAYAEESYEKDSGLTEDDLSADLPAPSDRKLIYSSNMDLETLEFDAAVAEITDLVTSLGGYMQESSIEVNTYSSFNERTAYFICRIPVKDFNRANERIAAVGNVRSKTEKSDDVTDQYYDVQAELDALKVQQERLLAMMEQTTNMEDLIALESALTDVRYRINDLTGAIRRYDGLIEYATISISLQEVVEYQELPPETFGDRIRNTFLGSLDFVRDFGEGIVLLVVAIGPFLIVYGGAVALLVGVILLFVKLAKRKKPKATAAPENKKQD